MKNPLMLILAVLPVLVGACAAKQCSQPDTPTRAERMLNSPNFTDLKTLDPGAEVMVWFGHLSYFTQTVGRRILVDPVFSSAAAPAG